MARLTIMLVLAVTLAGCGSESADLFAVERTGSIPGAQLEMVVNDGGTVSCNGGSGVEITSQELLDAREVQSDLEEAARDRLDLPPQRGSILRYRVETPEGVVHFADNSSGRSEVLSRLAFLVRRLAQERCGLPR
jgi:hypothetical protein